ncbi:hypothetical protein BKA69DRAFT_1063169 [Paraphysoderma sedebokerense]|nr:hypothetical protein BKA69DRAFT_1063169 [Paraphysoderma sedebokerense]
MDLFSHHTQRNRRYIWRTYCLTYYNQKLRDDNLKLSDLGIQNGSVFKFVRHLR